MEEQKFDRKYVNRAMILFSAFAILVLYIETMLIPSLPGIAKQYQIDPAEVSLLVSLYLVSGVALSPIIGKLGDIYGKKRVLTCLLPIYVIAVGLTGFLPSFNLILISRTIQGAGLTIFALMISLIQEEFPREMVPRAMAIIVAMFGVGSAIGLPIGSFISNLYGWQASYHTALPAVLIVAAAIIYYIRESRYTRPDVKVDYAGALGLAASLAMIVFALSEGTAYGWTSLPILSLIIGGLLILAGVVIYERRIAEPILSAKLMAIKNVMSANLITLIAGMSFFFAYQIFAYLFESPSPLGYGLSIFYTGLAMAPFAVVNVIVAPVLGRYIPRIGVKPFFLAGAVIGIIGFIISAFTSSLMIAILGEAIIGAGVALINVPTINLLVLSIDKRDTGLATSMNSVFRFLGSALGAPIAGLLIAQYHSFTAFQYSFYLGIITLTIAAIISTYADEIFGKNRKVTQVEREVSI